MGLSIIELPCDCLTDHFKELFPGEHIIKPTCHAQKDVENVVDLLYIETLVKHVEIQFCVAADILHATKAPPEVTSQGYIAATQPIPIQQQELTREYVDMLAMYFHSVTLCTSDQRIEGYFVSKSKASAVVAYGIIKERHLLNKYVKYFEGKGEDLFGEPPVKLHVCHASNTSISNDPFVTYYRNVVQHIGAAIVPLSGFNRNDIHKVALINEFFCSFKTSYIMSHNEQVVCTIVFAEDFMYPTES